MSATVNPTMLRSILPANPRSLVFKGAKHYRLPANVSYVSLEELESPEEVNTCTKVLVGIVIRYKRSKSSKDGRTLYSRLSQTSKSDQNFDRTMVIMCLNSQPGRNTAIVTMNGTKSDQMFKQNYPGRDGPDGFGPFAVVVITRPDNISNIFGDQAGIPVLSFSTGMRLVDVPASNFTLKERAINTTVQRLQAFYYPVCYLEMTNCNIDHTPCCGFLCDSVGMKTHDGNWRSGCPCYSVKKSLGYGVLDLNLNIKVANTDEILKTMHFTSRSFTNLLTVDGIPLAITSAMLEQSGADDTIIERVGNLLDHINTHLGGFQVLGWVRIGRIKDHSLRDAPGDESQTVAASTVNHHITKVAINCERSQFKDQLINVGEIYDRSLGQAEPET